MEGKIHKTISVNVEIGKDIKKRSLKYGFNFSEWVENQYKHQFLSIKTKQEEIKTLEKSIKAVFKEIEVLKEQEKAYSTGLSRNEKRFLLDVPRLLSEGKVWKPLCMRFNLSFHKDFSLEQFRKTVRFLQKENVRKKNS